MDALDDMAKDKKSKPGRPKDPKNEGMVAVFVEVDPALKTALEELAGRNRRTIKAQITLLFEEALEREGLWPPKGDDGE